MERQVIPVIADTDKVGQYREATDVDKISPSNIPVSSHPDNVIEVIEDGLFARALELTEGVVGAKGEKGDKGEQGEKGEKGDTGKTGPKGPAGDRGSDGYNGVDGMDGAKGDKGEPGEGVNKKDLLLISIGAGAFAGMIVSAILISVFRGLI